MKNEMKGSALAVLALASALLLMLGVGLAHAIQAGSAGSCDVFPELGLERNTVLSEPGRVATVKINVKGMQDIACGSQTYGVDFTNGYDGQEFALAVKGSQERNLFYLKPGETNMFEGLIGIPPGTSPGNYTLQIVAYPETDHWKQKSEKVSLQVRQTDASDAYWGTQLQIGWNLIPNVEGLGIYGCPEINTGYRYSAYKGDYITLNRYGAVFSVAPFEQDVENEKFGGLFVFSTQRCTMESRVPAYLLGNSQVSLRDGQLLSIPPAWQGAADEQLVNACMKQSKNPSDKVEMTIWDNDRQKWMSPAAGKQLNNGEVWRALANFDCTLNLDGKLASQVE